MAGWMDWVKLAKANEAQKKYMQQFDPSSQTNTDRAAGQIMGNPNFQQISSVQPQRGTDPSLPGGGAIDPMATMEQSLAEKMAAQNMNNMFQGWGGQGGGFQQQNQNQSWLDMILKRYMR